MWLLILIRFYLLGVLLAEFIIGLILLEQQRPEHHLNLPLDQLSSILVLLNKVVGLLPIQFMEREITSWRGVLGKCALLLTILPLTDLVTAMFLFTAWSTTLNEYSQLNETPQHRPSGPKQLQTLPLIRRAEFENHNKDGGLWLINNGKIYDIQDFKYGVANFGKTLEIKNDF